MQKDALQSNVLVLLGVGLVLAAGGGQAQELREHEQAAVKGLLRFGGSLGLGGRDGVGLVLGVLVCQALLQLRLVGRGAQAVVAVHLLILAQLLLEAGQLGEQGGLLQVLRLLVGIEDLEADELVEGLVGVLGDQRVGFGGMSL